MDCRDAGALGRVPVRAKVCAWGPALLPDTIGAQSRREDNPLKLKGSSWECLATFAFSQVTGWGEALHLTPGCSHLGMEAACSSGMPGGMIPLSTQHHHG